MFDDVTSAGGTGTIPGLFFTFHFNVRMYFLRSVWLRSVYLKMENFLNYKAKENNDRMFVLNFVDNQIPQKLKCTFGNTNGNIIFVTYNHLKDRDKVEVPNNK